MDSEFNYNDAHKRSYTTHAPDYVSGIGALRVSPRHRHRLTLGPQNPIKKRCGWYIFVQSIQKPSCTAEAMTTMTTSTETHNSRIIKTYAKLKSINSVKNDEHKDVRINRNI